MPFERLVEVGRVCMVNFGKAYGRLVVVVDIVDQAYALVEAPGHQREKMLYKRLSITPYVVDIPRGCTKAELKKAVDSSGAFKKFAESKWGKKLSARKAREALGDFDRYKARIAKQAKAAKVRAALGK